MGDKSNIEWTDATWSTITGCERISPGCAHCYAEQLTATRLAHQPKYKGLAVISAAGEPHWTGEVRLHPAELEKPLRWKRPRMIFVNSMSDTFHKDVPDEFLDRLFGVMFRARWHTYQVLTKRADRMAAYLGNANRPGLIQTRACLEATPSSQPDWFMANPMQWPLSNVWCGVSVEDVQRKARIDSLRNVSAAVRFLSVEPLLENLGQLDLTGIHWVIIGCESNGRRVGRLGTDKEFEWWSWALKIVEQCRAAGVAVFVKQVPLGGRVSHDPCHWHCDLRVRQFPEVA